MFHVPEKARTSLAGGLFATDSSYGNNGIFAFKKAGVNYYIIASDGKGWEHVSIHVVEDNNLDSTRCPTWEEMCVVKSIFWDDEDLVVQYHPPKSQYVNRHNFTLHLWRPTAVLIPLPPLDMV